MAVCERCGKTPQFGHRRSHSLKATPRKFKVNIQTTTLFENGRRRRYYRITKEGRAQLAAHRQQWKVVDGTLRGLWMKACTA